MPFRIDRGVTEISGRKLQTRDTSLQRTPSRPAHRDDHGDPWHQAGGIAEPSTIGPPARAAGISPSEARRDSVVVYKSHKVFVILNRRCVLCPSSSHSALRSTSRLPFAVTMVSFPSLRSLVVGAALIAAPVLADLTVQQLADDLVALKDRFQELDDYAGRAQSDVRSVNKQGVGWNAMSVGYCSPFSVSLTSRGWEESRRQENLNTTCPKQYSLPLGQTRAD